MLTSEMWLFASVDERIDERVAPPAGFTQNGSVNTHATDALIQRH